MCEEGVPPGSREYGEQKVEENEAIRVLKLQKTGDQTNQYKDVEPPDAILEATDCPVYKFGLPEDILLSAVRLYRYIGSFCLPYF